MAEVLIIGVGTPYRHDDAAGLALLDGLRERDLSGTVLAEETGEPAGLIARWEGHPLVVLVDAISSGAAPGTVHRLECCAGRWTAPPPSRQASTHGLGVADAVELARALDRLPGRLVVFGIETADVSQGTGLTPAVAAAVPAVVERIAGEVAQQTVAVD